MSVETELLAILKRTYFVERHLYGSSSMEYHHFLPWCSKVFGGGLVDDLKLGVGYNEEERKALTQRYLEQEMVGAPFLKYLLGPTPFIFPPL
ncbi:MAG: hypothetical protein HKN87_20115 [Saprospiraceae bacterium]|nr:hypothetical protein [Saprospiraceae bacterium]